MMWDEARMEDMMQRHVDFLFAEWYKEAGENEPTTDDGEGWYDAAAADRKYEAEEAFWNEHH